MGIHRQRFQLFNHKKPKMGLVYAAIIIYSFHAALIGYIDSTYIVQFVSSEAVGALFSIASAITIFIFLFASRVLKHLGNVRFIVWLAGLKLFASVLLATTGSAAVAIPMFVLSITLFPLILFNLDVFSETIIGDNEAVTGSRRGFVLTVMSLAGVIAPIATGYIVGPANNLALAYLVSGLFLVPFIALIITQFWSFKDPSYKDLDVVKSIHSFWKEADIRNVFLSHLLLQVFFAWMTIYTPLYLATVIGLSWDVLGLILGVGLFAYVIFEYPVGILADKYWGEKEMMAFGFVILAISSSWVAFMDTENMYAWMILMFVSRIGASFAEVTTESYFFKHVDGSDANVIGFFRITRPLAVFMGALIGSLTLLYLPFNLIFIVLGFLMVPGIFFTLALKDTK